MQDIRDELAHCIGALEECTTIENAKVICDVIDRLTKVVADMTERAAGPVDVPTDATRRNLVDRRLAVLGRDLDIIFHGLAKTTSALRELMQNPNLHPSVKLLADTIAINLLANPTTNEDPTR